MGYELNLRLSNIDIWLNSKFNLTNIDFQVQLLVSDSDVKSYKQIKDDLDGLRLLVEKSELWVYKSKNADEKGDKDKDEDEGQGQGQSNDKMEDKKVIEREVPPSLAQLEKQGSAIDLDIGPHLEPQQTRNYKTIQQILLRMNR